MFCVRLKNLKSVNGGANRPGKIRNKLARRATDGCVLFRLHSLIWKSKLSWCFIMLCSDRGGYVLHTM